MTESCTKENWFKKWFNTNYYHLLYKHRDDNEAQLFIDNLIQKLQPAPDSHILDLACGRGRHSIYLNQKGFEVSGMDLSAENIKMARAAATQNLHFIQGDMRENYGEAKYDLILNLFTSFGYFTNPQDNVRACKQMAIALKPRGKVLIDFLNVNQLESGLVAQEEKKIGAIKFQISRHIADGEVLKTIRVEDGNKVETFYEFVQLLKLEDFKNILQASGLRYEASYGNYAFGPFEPFQSNRLIILASKQ